MQSDANLEPLSERSRQLGLNVLLVGTFLMWGGFFLVVPLVSVHFVDGLGWAAASVGLILAVRQFLQQGFTVFGGVLSDRFGARGLIVLGLLVRAFGFGLMAFATSYPILMLSSILAALGGGLFDAPRNASIAALTTDESRPRYYSLMGVVGNLGMTIGPLAGALLIRSSFQLVALVSTACYVLTFFVTLWLLPNVQTAQAGAGGANAFSNLLLAARDRRFVTFTALLVGFWFLWSQLSISVALVAIHLAGSRDAVSWVYTLNSLMGIVLQIPMMRFLERRLAPTLTLALGLGLMALGLGAVMFVSSIVGLLGCVAVFSFGGLIASPVQQIITARMADPRALGSYFGVNALALAFGGGLGNYLGGVLYGLGQRGQPWLPWLTAALVGLTSMTGLLILRSWFEREPREVSVKPEPVKPEPVKPG
jgi:MFS transporter, DHA1 family, multidrug resistance protein